jgi:hypothetical protein
MKIVDQRKESLGSNLKFDAENGVVFESHSTDRKLQSKYHHMRNSDIDQIGQPSEHIIQDFVREAKIRTSRSPKKRKKRRVKQSDIIYEEGYKKSPRKKKKTKTKRKVRKIVVPECANPHRMTMSQKLRLQANLKKREEIKIKEEKKMTSRNWDKHFLKKTEESLDLGLNDPKYLKGIGNSEELAVEDPHYDEIRGYYLEKGRSNHTPLRSKMRKKKNPAVVLDIANSNTGTHKIYETNSVEHSKKMNEMLISDYNRTVRKKRSPRKKTPMRHKKSTKTKVKSKTKSKKFKVPKSPSPHKKTKKPQTPISKNLVN